MKTLNEILSVFMHHIHYVNMKITACSGSCWQPFLIRCHLGLPPSLERKKRKQGKNYSFGDYRYSLLCYPVEFMNIKESVGGIDCTSGGTLPATLAPS